MHNGSRFDFKLIIPKITERFTDNNITPIGKTKETYITFPKNKFSGTNYSIRFIDTYNHLSYALSDLVSTLSNNFKCCNDLRNIYNQKKYVCTTYKKIVNREMINEMKKKFPSLYREYPKEFMCLIRKDQLPHEYLDEDIFKKKIKIKYFYSDLNKEECSKHDYKYAKFIFKYF